MSAQWQMDPEARTFFSLVNRAVYANPFSSERERMDREIGGLMETNGRDSQINAAIMEVASRLQQMRSAGTLDVSRYSDSDRRILERAVAFDIFYRLVDRLDQFIQDQIAAGDEPIRADFAEDMLGALRMAGISDRMSIRYLEYSFQFRRAYYFIYQNLVGRSAGMQQLRERLWNNVFTHDMDIYDRHLRGRMDDFSTLILGQTGTGKGTVAAAIGQSGFIPFDETAGKFTESFCRSFIELNLSQYPETLIESELFGHRKGAFTGATYNHEGIFSRCSPHGAIFLDEIGDVAQPIQIKLLKVLEERQFNPVGSHEPLQFKGRVIAATNRTLDDIVKRKVLREDFLYRLCSDIIIVPPLCQRIQEDPLELDDLLAHTVQRIIGNPSEALVSFSREIIDTDLGKDYAWPGNVRELGQCVRQILLNREYRSIHREAAECRLDPAEGKEPAPVDLDAQALVQQHCYRLYREFGTYGEVARRTRLDRRTVKKYVTQWQSRRDSR